MGALCKVSVSGAGLDRLRFFSRTTNGGRERLATGRRPQVADWEHRREITWRVFDADAVENRIRIIGDRRCGDFRRPLFRAYRQRRRGDQFAGSDRRKR